MTYTVEKIGGTSMTAYEAVLNNIFLRPESPYNRVFVVSAYGGITDALLESKHTGDPGIYQLVAKREDRWVSAFSDLKQRMKGINAEIFEDTINRTRADKYIETRLDDAQSCIENILATCQYGQFTLRQYLPQIREFLSSIGEAHSAFNTALKLKSLGINARFVDLSSWDDGLSGNLDEVIASAFANIDVKSELPIVTGYSYCDEGLMKTYDRGYSEMTFSRIASITSADVAIIHKEYHLSSADPRIAGPENVLPIGQTNFDVADQLANLGMEAIHPNAASGLRQANIPLQIKNTFEPEHKGTLISQQYAPTREKIEIIAGKSKVFALQIFDQAMVGQVDNVGYEMMEIIYEERVSLIGKEMNANSITYYLSGATKNLNQLLYRAEKRFPKSTIAKHMVALISAIGAEINTNTALSKGMLALMSHDIAPIAVHSSMRNVNVQFVVKDDMYENAIRALHEAFFAREAVTKQIA
ncbi:aspartate kinase [Enterovibrio nigricans]|uniref:aspartate kinase n=1 Tax=Enterovibrio nigricans DSM 22720 TaxID=1121868 RepID=A0A1T4W0V8_9GAMM|nr:aspartate kinase [Enterovibrio nigricans]SKA70779.1 aspartate kinase [Enterovibrio nigricans DSM 22720]